MFNNIYCYALFQWCASVHMPLFFMIAGFCYSCRDYKTYLRKKFSRLVIPYIIFNLIDMLPRQLLASLVRRPKPFTESLIHMMLHGGEFWFIYVLFMIFLIYPLIFRFAGSSRIRMCVSTAILLALSIHGAATNLFLADRVSHYLFFFHLGTAAKIFAGGEWPQMKFPVYALPLSLGLWLVMLYSVKGFEVITALLGILTCCMMTRYTLFNDTFARFGEYSLQLYLLNGITLGISRAIICNVMHIYNPAAIIIFNMLVDFLASYLFIKHVCTRSKIIRLAMGMV